MTRTTRRFGVWGVRTLAGLAIGSLLLLIAACGGGSGGGLKTGHFVDGPVEGLKYATATQSGKTSANGAFRYKMGETVRFYVGDVLIGEAAGAPEVSPFDLAGIEPPQTGVQVRRALNAIERSKAATPFEVAINIAVFLQTLDEDGDPSNGIKIPEAMHTLASGVSLDFQLQWNAFPKDFPLRKLMAAGRGAGLWGGHRAIRKPALALGALYQGLGLAPEVYVIASVAEDTDADGTVDYREAYAYDADGNRMQADYDDDGDGTVDYRRAYAYDASGNPTLYEEDLNGDGMLDYREIYTYDADGNRTQVDYDDDGDGTVDYRRAYAYDASGN
ncbi:MAG TPA: hypothetical protein ENK37_01300, partial [Oceanithermus profundus]|nr:hypothetical protein [Oceanithermus profundus]